ncbi:MAG: hypothetical protein CVU88_08055 [Firmicutes bacterium HGW-Firmicutes-13]|nr:MAG: hypothetical protein CVU88_08055 [Firmicutes bacterium HGW-Firmicutes-13]
MAVQTNKNIGKAEFMSLFHQYQSENLCSKKCLEYANQIQNPSLKSIFQDIGNQCQSRANRLSQYLRESGGSHLLS